MKHIFLSCVTFCLLTSITVHGQKATKTSQTPHVQQQSEEPEFYEQVIRVKFKPEETARLDGILASKGNAKGVIQSQAAGPLQTGFTALDNRNAQYEAKGMRRVFRPAGKFEARHREWGLHLWYEIRFSSQTPVSELMHAYAQVASLEKTEPVFKYSLRDAEGTKPLPYVNQRSVPGEDPVIGNPDDPRYNEQWGFPRINAAQAWEIETGDPRVVVAIEDQGVDYTHADLDGRMWTNIGETPGNGIDDDNNGYIDDYYGYNFGDDQGEIAIGTHGTHVGGTVAAETNNGTGVSGTAGGWGDNQGVRLMSLSVFGANSQGGFDEAFIYAADNGAVISQNSWGGGSQSNVLEDAIDYFIANAGGSGEAMEGGLVVFAAGNSDSSNPSQGYPASYAPTVAVASIDSQNKKSGFSNYGAWVDISAPGSAILSTYPDNSYNSISGTSMACPHVSGVAALVVSYNYGAITSAELRNKLEGTTTDVYADNPTYDGQLGTGVIDAYAALTGEPAPPSYCASMGNSVADEWIETIAIGDFTHNSGSNGGYANFTSTHTVELTTGSSYNLSLTPGFSGGSYQEYWKIWIDLNGDKDFEDAGELVFDAGSLSSSTVTGTLSIDAAQDTLTTRMRVSMKYNAAPGPCEFFAYGEVEDYTLHIINGDTPPPPACDTPDALTASNVGETTATLSWNPVDGADSYTARYRPTGDSVWIYVVTEMDSVELRNLQDGTTYEAEVASVCGEATSEYSAAINFTTEETVPPACDTPDGLAVSGIGETTATLNWNAVDGADSYHVRYRPTADSVWADVQTGTSTFDLTSLEAGTEYEAQVASVCGDVTSDYSASITFTTEETTPPACDTPSGLAVDSVAETSATLNWEDAPSADSYEVRYRTTADSSWTYLSTAATSATISSLEAGTEYEAQVASVCGDVTSDYSASVSFTTTDGSEPPVEYCSASGRFATFFWIDLVRAGSMNNPSGSDGGYGDYTSLAPGTLVKGASNNIVVSAGYSGWKFTLHWRIWIDYNQDGTFDSSEIFESGTSNSADELMATNTVPSSALSGSTRMRVAMKYTSYAGACETFSYGEVEDYTVNISSSASPTSFVARTEGNPLTEKVENAFMAYPNPVNNSLKLNTEMPAGIEMNIIDARGANVKTIISTAGVNALDVQDLKPGIYHLNIQTPLEAIQLQFIKL